MSLNNLKNEAQKIRMTPEEKAMLKSRIFNVPAQSPYVVFNFQFSKILVSALAVLVVLVGSGGGVAYAAEGSLPGQPLYAVKVNVDEPVEVALAPTPQAKADVYAQLAQTRVDEAEALAAQGQLDATTTQELTQNFDAQVAAATTTAAQVAAQDPVAATDIETSLSASLEAGGAVLAEVGQESGTTTARDSRVLALRVLARAQELGLLQGSAVAINAATGAANASTASSSASSSVEVAIAPQIAVAPVPSAEPAMHINALATIAPQAASSSESESTSSMQVVTATATATPATSTQAFSAESQTRAAAALASAQSVYASAKSSLDASTTAALDIQFAQAQTYLDNGNSQAALRLSVKLQTLIEAAASIDANILPLLQMNVKVIR